MVPAATSPGGTATDEAVDAAAALQRPGRPDGPVASSPSSTSASSASSSSSSRSSRPVSEGAGAGSKAEHVDDDAALANRHIGKLQAEEEEPEEEEEDEDGSLALHFRNYVPRDANLRQLCMPRPTVLELARQLEQSTQEAIREAETQEVLSLIAPRRPNWDLKRDLERKLQLLSHRTERSILQLIKEKVVAAKIAVDSDTAKSLPTSPSPGAKTSTSSAEESNAKSRGLGEEEDGNGDEKQLQIRTGSAQGNSQTDRETQGLDEQENKEKTQEQQEETVPEMSKKDKELFQSAVAAMEQLTKMEEDFEEEDEDENRISENKKKLKDNQPDTS
eukprot:GHVT01022935.1.p1 GENE.GHVT01022935.1~~GHVT01022935.1.p1  ORF type:complete len:333 (-),score=105.32 GHVT01022935.1:998-1996(-)